MNQPLWLAKLAKLALRGLPKLPNETQEIQEIECEGLRNSKSLMNLR
jgi:hypothetical protein